MTKPPSPFPQTTATAFSWSLYNPPSPQPPPPPCCPFSTRQRANWESDHTTPCKTLQRLPTALRNNSKPYTMAYEDLGGLPWWPFPLSLPCLPIGHLCQPSGPHTGPQTCQAPFCLDSSLCLDFRFSCASPTPDPHLHLLSFLVLCLIQSAPISPAERTLQRLSTLLCTPLVTAQGMPRGCSACT